MPTLVNNTVLSNLAFVDRVDLLGGLFGRVFVPAQVYEELLRGIDEGYTDLERAATVIEAGESGGLALRPLATAEEHLQFRRLLARLDYGEAACLAMACQEGWLVLTDDRDARRVAAELGVPVSGSVGVLRLAVTKGLLSLDEANGLLQGMIAHRYHSPVADLRDLD